MRGWRFKGKGNAGRIKARKAEREGAGCFINVGSGRLCPTCDVVKFKGEEKFSP